MDKPRGKYFNFEEFTCRDGTQCPEKFWPDLQKLIDQLDIIREEIGQPLHVISGYRSPEYNAKIDGAKQSQHMLGCAADLTCKKMTAKKLYSVIVKLIKEKRIFNGGLGRYPGFSHYDIGSKRRWNG